MDWYRKPGHLLLAALTLCAAGFARPLRSQKLTVVPTGAIRVERNQLVDSRNVAFLIRGTQLPEFRTQSPVPRKETAGEFGPHSATILNTIRQRWNMNAVRLPLDLSDYENDPKYLQAASEVVRTANRLELLVLLSARRPGASYPSEMLLRFWRDCATFFKDYPQLIFELDADTPALMHAVRAAGSRQPIVAENPGDDGNAIHKVSPQYKTMHTDEDRDRQFGETHGPMLASDLDPELDRDSEECRLFPGDPSDAEAAVEANLAYFDAHAISWVASEFRPGKLITDYRYIYPSSLENGWTCGQPGRPASGIGEMIQFHLWGGEVRGLFAVNAAGNFMLPRGGIAIVYGGIFAERDARNSRTPPSTELAKVSVLITDRAGVTRRAGMLYVTAGWGQANIIVPPDCAVGPAQLTVTGRDGSRGSTPIGIVDFAPGFWTGTIDGRGPAVGFATRTGSGRPPSEAPIVRCEAGNCHTIAIPVSAGGFTTVRLLGSGFRYAAGISDLRVEIGGVAVPVVSYGPAGEAGLDQLTIRIPSSLGGVGETDLFCSIHGSLSNVVRIHIGPVEQSR